MAYPQPKVLVPTSRDEDCRGGLIVPVLIAFALDALLVAVVMAIAKFA